MSACRPFGRRRSDRCAFTLVELLVVIGIIAVLISIIFPVMSRMRNSARVVACQSNVRQLVQASMAYAADNDGILPLPNLKAQDSPTTPGWLYQNSPTTAPPPPPPPAPPLSPVQLGVLWKYLNSGDVYHCPLDSGPWSATSTETLTSYLMNPSVVLKQANQGAASSFNSSSYALRRMNSQAILFIEEDQGPPPPAVANRQSWVDGAAQLDKDDAVRHGTVGASIGCFDGHVEMMTRTEYTNQQTLYRLNPPQGRFYCLLP
jgi:prepilin-type N-terminal cleavage/methylation domain-containing protein